MGKEGPVVGYVDEETTMLPPSSRYYSEAVPHDNFSTSLPKEQRKLKYYRPIATRSWTLAGFLCAVVAAIALLEVTLASHHRVSDFASISRRNVASRSLLSHELEKRQTSQPPNAAELTLTTTTPTIQSSQPPKAAELTLTTTSPTDVSTGDPSPTSELTLTTVPGAELSLTTPNNLVSSTSPGAELSPTQKTLTTVPGAELSLTTPNDLVSSISPGAQLSLTQKTSYTTSHGAMMSMTTASSKSSMTGDPPRPSQLSLVETSSNGKSRSSTQTGTSLLPVAESPSRTPAGLTPALDGLETTSGGSRTTSDGLRITSDDSRITSDGSRTTSDGLRTTSDGLRTTSDNSRTSSSGSRTTSDGLRITSDDSRITSGGSRTTSGGSRTTSDNSRTTSDNSRTSSSGSRTTSDGLRTTSSGSRTTSDSSRTTSDGSSTAPGKPPLGGEMTFTSTSTPSTSTAFYSDSASDSDSSDPASHLTSELSPSHHFRKVDYFFAMYFPTLLAVILQSAWAIIFSSMKMMEPFYQLARPCGASAKNTLSAEYLSSGLSLPSLQAGLGGHWVILLASLVQIMISLVVPLAGESMTVEPTAYCKTELSDHQPCDPAWMVSVPVLRSLEALLSLVFLLIFLIVLLNRRRVSGVFSDPSKIATMANLLGHDPFMDDLRDIPPQASKSEVKKALAGNRYMLGTYTASTGHQRYGVIKLPSSPTAAYVSLLNPSYASHHPQSLSISGHSSHHILRALHNLLLLVLTLGLLSIILAYYLMHGKEPLNVFLNSNTFGPRFLLSTLAVLVSLTLKRLERETRLIEPYRLMSSHLSKPAHETVLAGMTSTPLTAFFISVTRGRLFLSALALAALLSEIVIIAMPGIPFSAAQIHPAYLASTYVSIGVLSVIALAAIAVFWRRRSDPRIPRVPDTLAGVWLYLCASDWVAGAQLDDEGDEVGIENEKGYGGKRYWFGVARGVDGRQRWKVDEDY